MKLSRSALWFAGGIILTAAVGAIAAQTNYLGTVFIADPTVNTRQMTVNADGSINTTTSGTTTNGGYVLTGSPAPFAVTTSSSSVTGLTLPGKVRFQASPVTTLGGGTISTVAVQVNYSGGNACTQPDVVLGAGQIDDWISITTATAPTVCAAASTNVLVTQ